MGLVKATVTLRNHTDIVLSLTVKFFHNFKALGEVILGCQIHGGAPRMVLDLQLSTLLNQHPNYLNLLSLNNR